MYCAGAIQGQEREQRRTPCFFANRILGMPSYHVFLITRRDLVETDTILSQNITIKAIDLAENYIVPYGDSSYETQHETNDLKD